MLTIGDLGGRVHMSRRRVGLAICGLGALAVTACGGDISLAPRTSIATPTASPASATATPGPASLQATLTGDAKVSGPLVMGATHFITCDAPSLAGTTILGYENATDPAIGVLLNIRASAIQVRLAENAGGAYTARVFDGTGVSSFNPLSGASFSSSLTEVTPAGSNKGTIGSISSISGSISCGTFTPGSASLTVAGDTVVGTVGGALTAVRVICANSATGRSVSVSGLSHVGSTPVLVSVFGGLGGTPFYTVVQTTSAAYQYSSATPGIVTLSSGQAQYNGSAKEFATSTGAAGRSVTVTGSATCGT